MQGSLRVHMLDLMACMGVEVCKAMPPHSITHVIAGDLHDNTSKKLVHAREVQCALFLLHTTRIPISLFPAPIVAGFLFDTACAESMDKPRGAHQGAEA